MPRPTSSIRAGCEALDRGSFQVDHPNPFTLTPRESHTVHQKSGRLARVTRGLFTFRINDVNDSNVQPPSDPICG